LSDDAEYLNTPSAADVSLEMGVMKFNTFVKQ